MYQPLRHAWKFAAFSLLISMIGHAQPAHSTVRVVSSHSVLCNLTQQIAQTTIDLDCLIEAGQDPHVYQLTPSDRRAIETAQLILYGGYNFEPDIIRAIEATRTAVPKVAVSQIAVPQPLMGEAHDHDHESDHAHEQGRSESSEQRVSEHSHGHSHGHSHNATTPTSEQPQADAEVGREADPHVWHDAENGVRMVEVIRDSLKQVSPENSELYTRNAQAIIDQLQQVDRWIATQVATIPVERRTLVTTHDALGYYGNAYGLKIEDALGSLSTETRPSAARIREVVETIRATTVPTVFAETTNNPRLMQTVAREAKVTFSEQPIYADSLGEAGTPAASYQGMLITNTCAIVNGLGGRCDTGSAQAFIPR